MPKVTGLGHVGLYVKDVPKMVEFYSGFLGMEVTDRADDDRIVFLSARPQEEHHELALARSAELKTEAQQVSFTVATLDDLKGFYRQIKERGYPVDRVVNHGIAFGCYFRDPEGNRIEVYWPTGKDYPQPHGDPIDLEASDEALIGVLNNMPDKARAGAAL
ncbi:MAG TPA: VOC family protein [Dehalococcoidia bacterium]|nr:VOC family protein [Dehalococcoidia bacterium]